MPRAVERIGGVEGPGQLQKVGPYKMDCVRGSLFRAFTPYNIPASCSLQLAVSDRKVQRTALASELCSSHVK